MIASFEALVRQWRKEAELAELNAVGERQHAQKYAWMTTASFLRGFANSLDAHVAAQRSAQAVLLAEIDEWLEGEASYKLKDLLRRVRAALQEP